MAQTGLLLMFCALASGAAPSDASGAAPAEPVLKTVTTPQVPLEFRAGIGFTADPGTFLTGFELDLVATSAVQIGPAIQIGVSDRRTLIAPTLNLRYLVGLPDVPKGLSRLKPFFQAGVGAAYLEKERKHRRDEREADFMLNAGFGLQYDVTERMALGSFMLFNIIPGEAASERFFFSWQVLAVILKF